MKDSSYQIREIVIRKEIKRVIGDSNHETKVYSFDSGPSTSVSRSQVARGRPVVDSVGASGPRVNSLPTGVLSGV